MKNNEEIKINKSQKIGFLKRIKNAVFKLENYEEFVLEKTKVAIFYFFKLMFLVSIIISSVSTYNFNKIVAKGYNYIKNELPDFNYAEGKVIVAEDKEAYDEDLDLYTIFRTNSEIDIEEENELKNKVKDYKLSIIFLQNKVILIEYGQAMDYKYTDLQTSYNIEKLSRQELIEMLDTIGIYGINITYFVVSLLSIYIANIITIGIDVLLVYLFGLVISRLCGVSIPSSKVLSLSIYSLTLSILLSTAYSIVYSITGFVIEYFDIMYLFVAYVYLIAAILIIKSKAIKQKIELQKIVEVEKQVKKELEEERQEENNKKDKEDKEDKKDDENKQDEPIINREPDGSEI